jgi:adenosine deaminase
MQTGPALERVAYEFAVDNYSEGVRYFEVRFAPQLHAHVLTGLSIEQVVACVNKGLKRAKDEQNAARLERVETWPRHVPPEPRYDYGIIVCAMRLFSKEMSRYYAALIAVLPDLEYDRVAALASETLVMVAKKCRDELKIPVVGIDIAGAEAGYKASIHKDAFDLAHGCFLNKTVHAGEGYGPESIFQAVRDLHAERIGHGFHLFSEHLVEGEENVADSAGYVKRLTKFICDRRINIEVCLSSNLGTMPNLKLEDHAFAKMLTEGVSVTLNTDNRLVSNTTVTNEIKKAVDTFAVTPSTLKCIIVTGFKRSFFPGAYAERREYVRSVIAYYGSLLTLCVISLFIAGDCFISS